MRLKDLFSKAINKNTKQIQLCPRKRLIKKKGIDIKELLEMELDEDDFKKW